MNFKQLDIDRYIKNPDPKIRCALIFGTSEGMIAESARQMASAVCSDLNDPFRVAVLPMETLEKDIGALYGEFNARSLMGGRRVVFVRDANNNLTAPLKHMLAESSSDTLLVLTSLTLNTKSSLVTLAKDNESFAHIACYEDREGDIRAFARDYLSKQKITITDEAAQLLCARLSGDRKASLAEMDKLTTYLGTRRHIELDDVRGVVSDTSDSSFEDLCYLTGCGQTDKALEAYAELLHQGEEPATVTRSLIGHFMRLLEWSSALESGQTFEALQKSMYPKLMFYRKADLQLQLRIWKQNTLLDALDILQTCERDCKTTGYPTEDVVSYTILRLAGGARKFIKR